METTGVLDFDKICRICLRQEIYVSVFSESFEDHRPIDMIVQMNIFKFDYMDTLPTNLCHTCIYRLIDAFKLKQESYASECRLRNFLNPLIPIRQKTIFKREHDIQNTVLKADELNTPRDDEVFVNAVCEILDDQSNNRHFAAVNFQHQEDNIIVDESSLAGDITVDENSLQVGTDEFGDRDSHLQIDSPSDLHVSKNVEIENCAQKTSIATAEVKLKPGCSSYKSKDCKCSICGKQFSYAVHLETHMRKHTGEKPFQCHICKRFFSQSGNLIAHLRTHSDKRLFQCEICSKMFTTSSNLIAHRKIHLDDRPFPCSKCEKVFRTQPERISHEAIHSENKNFTCSICQKLFHKTAYLNLHIRTVHKNEKPHKCTQCTKMFATKSNLTSHIRIHTGEKPFKCKICNSAFNQAATYKRHIKKHQN